LAAWIGVCLAASGIGSYFTFESVQTWYPTLQKPAWTPPSWVFGPVWTTLYVLMGTAAWRVWRHSGLAARAALTLFGIQLVLNTAWSGLFFGLRAPGLAFVELVLLWAAILATLLRFRPLDRPAAWLLAPYLAWVTFAGGLNLALWQLNQ
jgi:tryptophan-rich sensory protein